MYVDNWETQAKTTVMSLNKYLHVHGDWGDSSVNAYPQIFTCMWTIGKLMPNQRQWLSTNIYMYMGIGGEGGGGGQAKTMLMSLYKYLHVPGNWGEI